MVFAVGWVLGPIRTLLLEPRVGPLAAVVLEAPRMVAVMIVAARWVLGRPRVVPALATRAAIGLVALTLLLVAELAGARWLRGLSSQDYLEDRRSPPGAISLLLFLLFAVIPVIVRRPRH
ncbi:MAG: hypothetical protein ACRELZ_22220 [Candidatus Rokuibacteriota bacterium]